MATFAMRSAVVTVVLSILPLLAGAPACAFTKLWVAKSGVDSPSCGAVASPCATFQRAHDNISAGGEIGVLTPGDYGVPTNPVTAGIFISKSVSITSDTVGEAGILNTSSLSVAVNIDAAASDVVGLRGLVLDGLGAGAKGIQASHLSALHVQNCVIRNFEGSSSPYGIATLSTSGRIALFVSDTLIYNNGSASNSGGILLGAMGGSISAVLDRVRLENNVIGLNVLNLGAATDNFRVTVRDTTISGNAGDGIVASTNGVSSTVVLVERSAAVNNTGSGLHADGAHSLILLGDSIITNNSTGVSRTNGGQLISYGDNRNHNNVGDEGTASAMFSLF